MYATYILNSEKDGKLYTGTKFIMVFLIKPGI